MGYQVTAQYRKAEARYDIAGTPQGCTATLLHYAGPQHNCPPRRFVVLIDMVTYGSNLTDDICLSRSHLQQAPADPLFPEKKCRNMWVDNLV